MNSHSEPQKTQRVRGVQLVEGLLKLREAARASKDFEFADEIRTYLSCFGVQVNDGDSYVGWQVMLDHSGIDYNGLIENTEPMRA